jgi:hypothetical protein
MSHSFLCVQRAPTPFFIGAGIGEIFLWILKKISELCLLNNFFFSVAIKNKCLILFTFFLTEKYDHFETAYKEKKRKWGMRAVNQIVPKKFNK